MSGCNTVYGVMFIDFSALRHPDLHKDEIAAIQEMFEEAKQKGWLS